MNCIHPSNKKLAIGKSYKSGIQGTLFPANSQTMKQSSITWAQKENYHYERNAALYFNYLDENMVCVRIEKVV